MGHLDRLSFRQVLHPPVDSALPLSNISQQPLTDMDSYILIASSNDDMHMNPDGPNLASTVHSVQTN